MSTRPEPTAEISTNQAWALIWNELDRIGMAPHHSGPIEAGINWGENANQAIEGLQAMNLPVPAVCNVGILVQATIRAAEVRFKRGK